MNISFVAFQKEVLHNSKMMYELVYGALRRSISMSYCLF